MPGPLDGLRILDFTWALAGPYGSMILTDLGADVYKVEHVDTNERHRGAGPYVHGVSTYFFSVNRGKKSVTLDLKHPEAVKIIKDLIDPASGGIDVLSENFRPGAMARLGLGYEDLSAVNPRLIYASTSGFGHSGPYQHRPAVDVIVQGMGGVMSITGHPGGPPARPGYSIGDMAGGMYTAIGVLAALHERHSSGLGQHVDVAMLDAQVALLENAVVRAANTDEVPGPIGTRHPLVTPFQALPTVDGWMVIAGVKDWQLFCVKIERDDSAPRRALPDQSRPHRASRRPGAHPLRSFQEANHRRVGGRTRRSLHRRAHEHDPRDHQRPTHRRQRHDRRPARRQVAKDHQSLRLPSPPLQNANQPQQRSQRHRRTHPRGARAHRSDAGGNR